MKNFREDRVRFWKTAHVESDRTYCGDMDMKLDTFENMLSFGWCKCETTYDEKGKPVFVNTLTFLLEFMWTR